MMCPRIVLAGGRVRLVAGSGGSKRIRTALLQVASAVLDFVASVGDAVEAPRLHWDGAVLQVEPGVAEAALAGLGPEVPRNVWPVRDVYFGGVQAVAPAEGAAAADPRRGGAARVLG
jgi:gamma-glutamyltranspeptidase/glutathione hydrolase